MFLYFVCFLLTTIIAIVDLVVQLLLRFLCFIQALTSFVHYFHIGLCSYLQSSQSQHLLGRLILAHLNTPTTELVCDTQCYIKHIFIVGLFARFATDLRQKQKWLTNYFLLSEASVRRRGKNVDSSSKSKFESLASSWKKIRRVDVQAQASSSKK